MSTKKESRRLRNAFLGERAPKPLQEDAETPARAEYAKALGRIGPTPAHAVRWLLKFIQENIDELSSGDLTNRAFEIASFAYWGTGDKGPSLASIKQWKWAGSKYLTYPEGDEIKTLQRSLRNHIERLLRSGHTAFEIQKLKLDIGADHDTPYFSLSTESAFEYRIAVSLGEQAHRIRRCGSCQTIFLAVRRKQQWCSTRCQSRMGTKRFREKQLETGYSKRKEKH